MVERSAYNGTVIGSNLILFILNFLHVINKLIQFVYIFFNLNNSLIYSEYLIVLVFLVIAIILSFIIVVLIIHSKSRNKKIEKNAIKKKFKNEGRQKTLFIFSDSRENQ